MWYPTYIGYSHTPQDIIVLKLKALTRIFSQSPLSKHNNYSL